MLSAGLFVSRRLVPVVFWWLFPSVAKSSEDQSLTPWQAWQACVLPLSTGARAPPALPSPGACLHLASCFGAIECCRSLTFLQSIWADPKVPNLIPNPLDNTSPVCHTVAHPRRAGPLRQAQARLFPACCCRPTACPCGLIFINQNLLVVHYSGILQVYAPPSQRATPF